MSAYYGLPRPGSGARQGNPFAVAINALSRASRSIDFWLLTRFRDLRVVDEWLINTHLIAYCGDHGIAVRWPACSPLSAVSLMGRRLRWLCDRFLAFCCSGITGCAGLPAIVPFTEFDVVSLSIFSVFYGLVATGLPPSR